MRQKRFQTQMTKIWPRRPCMINGSLASQTLLRAYLGTNCVWNQLSLCIVRVNTWRKTVFLHQNCTSVIYTNERIRLLFAEFQTWGPEVIMHRSSSVSVYLALTSGTPITQWGTTDYVFCTCVFFCVNNSFICIFIHDKMTDFPMKLVMYAQDYDKFLFTEPV